MHAADTALATAPVVAASRQVLATHAKSFRFASVLLPSAQRDDAAVVYALCRELDDAVDEAPSRAHADAAARALSDLLDGRRPPTPLFAAFFEVAERRRIPLEAARELLRGVHSDVGDVMVADDAELVRYGYRVAGTVGLMMGAVIGVEDDSAWPHAVDLGVAMQITNICRDVAEDAGRGRVYLPATRLHAAGTSPRALLAAAGAPTGAPPAADRAAVARVVLDLLELADRYYASGRAGLRYIPARPRAAIDAAARIYRAIGTVLRRRAGDAYGPRAYVGTAGKLGRLILATATAPLASLTPVRAHDPALHGALAGLPGADPRVSA